MDFNMASNVTASQMQQVKQFKRPRIKLIRPEITVLTEKVEEKLDLIRSKFSDIAIASQTQRRMLRGSPGCIPCTSHAEDTPSFQVPRLAATKAPSPGNCNADLL